jgi:hypothetical protein
MYAAATPVQQTFVVNPAPVSQTITFGAIATQNVGTPLMLGATASSGLAVSYASSTAAVCTVSGSTATFIASGTCSITASQAGNATYAAATPVSQSFTVNAALKAQTITFGTIAAQTVGTPLTLTGLASASSGLAVSYASNTSTICTVSGTSAQFLAAGTCTLVASQAGNSMYAAATPVSQNITVNAAAYSQTITFNAIATQTLGTPLMLSASATSNLAVSFASNSTAVCMVSGTTASFLTAGTCSITASQPGNNAYAAATPVTQSFTVNPGPQTISFGAIPAQAAGTSLTLSATASSGLAVSFASTTTSVCTVSGTTASFSAAGTCTVTASQAGNSNYAAATPVSQNITVLQAQTITFGAIAAQTVGTPLTLSATATSGLTVSFASTTTGVCTVSGSAVTFVAPGTCSITASQAGNTTYSAATPVTQSFTVNAAPKAQTITFGTINAQQVGTPLSLNATATSGLAVSFVSNSTAVCTVSGTTATLVASGTCSITASQTGNSSYAAATPVTQSFAVNGQGQIITFGAIAAQQAGTTLTLNATASSGLAVSYASSTGSVCTVSGSTASLVAAGTCSITASQAGSSSYAAATPVSQSFTVQAAASGNSSSTTTTVSLGSAANVYGIFNDGSTVTNGGLDTSNYAYSASLLGTSLTFQGIPYAFGTPGSANAASASTIALPAGSYSSINFLGTAIYGNQPSQTFTVTYTDGTTSTFTQSLSDWSAPQSYSSETVAATMSYRLSPNGSQQSGPWYLYAYSFALNSAKTVKSFTLPNSRNVTVLAVTLSAQAAQTITFNALPSQIVGGTLTVSATASSGLPVTFTVVPNGNCSVSGNVVTFLNVGNCGVVANQAGNSSYLAATPVGQIVVVNQGTAQSITFGAIAAQTVGTPLTLTATASSGLAVSYASSTTGVCTVSGSTATFVAGGTCSITASQAGNNVYSAASPVTQSFTVNSALQSQTITFGAIAAQTVGTPLTLTATASSNLAVTYASSTTSICTVSGGTATFLAAGTCTITASQAGNGSYAAATPVSQSFTVNAAALKSQTITFGALAAQTVGTPLTLTATASSNLAVTYSSSTTSICTVSGSTATFVAVGTCTITASQAGNSTYAAATSVSQSFTVNGQAQTITFNSIPAQTVGSTLTVTATASSALPVTFTVVPNGNCSVSGNVVTFLNVGNCGVVANQAGNSAYAAAAPVGQIVVVNNPTPQTISFGTIAAQTVGTPLTLTATATSGLAVSYASSTTSICTVSGNTVSFAAAGTCTITASQAGNSTYSAATPVSQSFTVNAAALKSQTITFNSIAAQTVGTPLTLTATASSSLAVTYASSTTAICTVSGSTATFVAAGTCTITASQAGNSTYTAATSVSQSFTVNGQPQTITFNSIPAQTVGSTLTVSATASSGLPVTFTVVPNGNCSVSGNAVTFLNAGNCGVIANQAGNSAYAAAASVGQVIVVNNSTPQSITFGTIATQTVGTPLTLTATASSGLAVSYASSTTSICTVSGSTATFVAAGTCTITASQAGNSTYSAAASVTQSFTVQAAQTPVSLTSAANVYGIFANGSSVSNGGLDNYSYAYSANLLGSSLTVGGIPFTLASAGAADAVANTKVTLPAGSYSTLYFLATAVDGNQTSQKFTVTYTDGTTTVATQSLSDWGAPQSYSGESTASTMAYRVTPSGGTQSQNWYLYEYSIALNSAKTVQSVTLPSNRMVVVLAMTLAH